MDYKVFTSHNEIIILTILKLKRQDLKYKSCLFFYKKLAKDFLLCYNKHRKVIIFAMLAQLDRAFVYGTKGQGFESLASHQIKSAKYVADFIFYNILIIL